MSVNWRWNSIECITGSNVSQPIHTQECLWENKWLNDLYTMLILIIYFDWLTQRIELIPLLHSLTMWVYSYSHKSK